MKLLRIVAILMFISIVGMVVSAPGVYAYPVSAGDWIQLNYAPPDYPRYSNGGPFKVTDGAVSFLTFCVETNEYFTPGNTYYVGYITNAAINGGVGGGSPDPISPMTGYLYYKFITGSYPKDYSDDLQLAIWKIEGEYTGTLTGTALALYNEALANYIRDPGLDPLWGVRVLNLYYDTHKNSSGMYDHYAQDQLVYVPEPSTLLLLGTGLFGLGLWGIRKKRKG